MLIELSPPTVFVYCKCFIHLCSVSLCCLMNRKHIFTQVSFWNPSVIEPLSLIIAPISLILCLSYPLYFYSHILDFQHLTELHFFALHPFRNSQVWQWIGRLAQEKGVCEYFCASVFIDPLWSSREKCCLSLFCCTEMRICATCKSTNTPVLVLFLIKKKTLTVDTKEWWMRPKIRCIVPPNPSSVAPTFTVSL